MPGLYDPEQVERLIATSERLSGELAAHKRQLAVTDKRAKYAKAASIVGMFVGIIGIAVGVQAWSTAHDLDQLVETRQRETTEARISSCVQFNVQRAETRAAMKLALGSLVPTTATEQQRLALETYGKSVDLGLPYRNCSPEGIEAYFKSPPKDPAIGG
jgi:hypothetical protein